MNDKKPYIIQKKRNILYLIGALISLFLYLLLAILFSKIINYSSINSLYKIVLILTAMMFFVLFMLLTSCYFIKIEEKEIEVKFK